MPIYHRALPKIIPALFFSGLTLGLGACGGSGQDKGAAQLQMRTYSGVAVDGYIARSMVFLDFDNNASRDPWEPFAFTDDNGYFSYNPLTSTDYCAADADATLATYCLQSRRNFDQAVLRVDGGYDVMTGEPFAGQMSRRIDSSEADASAPTVISPLTTVFTEVTEPDAKENLLLALGILEDDLDVDYLNVDGSGSADSDLFGKALKVHKVATVLADRLQDSYGAIGGEVGMPSDVSALVYKHLASQLASGNENIDTALTSTSGLQAALHAAELDVQGLYEQRSLLLPSFSNGRTMEHGRVAQSAVRLPELVDALLPAQASTTAAELKGRVRALEAVVIKTVQEGAINDDSIEGAVGFLTDPANLELTNIMVSALGDERADLASLARNRFQRSDLDTVERVMNASRLPESAAPFQNVVGKKLRVSDLDLGVAPDSLRDLEVEVYFQGSDRATKGTFAACIKYIEGANQDGTLGEANTRGELVHGQWSLLDAESNGGASYSLLLTIGFLGAQYQAIMKPAGTEVVNEVEYQKVRFDYANEIRAWHSQDGMQAADSVPASEADCQKNLPSRIGL